MRRLREEGHAIRETLQALSREAQDRTPAENVYGSRLPMEGAARGALHDTLLAGSSRPVPQGEEGVTSTDLFLFILWGVIAHYIGYRAGKEGG